MMICKGGKIMNRLDEICWKISDYVDLLKEKEADDVDIQEDLQDIVEYCKAIAYENGINLD